MEEAYQDEGFYVGLSKQRWGDFGVRKQLSLGTNFEQGKRGETGGVIPTGSAL